MKDSREALSARRVGRERRRLLHQRGSRAADPTTSTTEPLQLNSVAEGVTNLGPGPATLLWTQGCHVGCRGCMSVDTWNPFAGVRAQPSDVATWLLTKKSRFLTISGGEPTEQAPALNALLDHLDEQWVVTMYSGHDLEALRAADRPGVTELLGRIDVLIAGPYIQERHARLLWRASDNQVIHDLTLRAPIAEDLSAGISVRITGGGLEIIGVPPEPGFIDALRSKAADGGSRLGISRQPRTFPFPTLEP